MVKLGEKRKDSITGFLGVAIARTEYLNGCVSICLQPDTLTDGKIGEAVWFDEQRLDENSTVKTGGPGPVPPTMNPRLGF